MIKIQWQETAKGYARQSASSFDSSDAGQRRHLRAPPQAHRPDSRCPPEGPHQGTRSGTGASCPAVTPTPANAFLPMAGPMVFLQKKYKGARRLPRSVPLYVPYDSISRSVTTLGFSRSLSSAWRGFQTCAKKGAALLSKGGRTGGAGAAGLYPAHCRVRRHGQARDLRPYQADGVTYLLSSCPCDL